jgi:hypothetical protein
MNFKSNCRLVCVFWYKSCLTQFHWHPSLPHPPLAHAAASPAAGVVMHACNRDGGCRVVNHVDEQRACAADGLAITRWICG